MNELNDALSQEEVIARSKIGRYLVYWAVTAVSILGVVAIIAATYKSTASEALVGIKDILAITLPVIATWVGTVLAFYFSKENYVAAAENNAAVLGLTFDKKLESL